MSTDKLSVDFLNPNECRFTVSDNGFLLLTLAGENRGRVLLRRCYPFVYEDEYISLHDLEDKEIGILRDLKELDEEGRKLCEEHLTQRYYCPTVSSVKSIKERMGNFYFETVIDGIDKTFTVKDISRNMRLRPDDSLLIFDADGNRYNIPGYSKIDRKSKRLLEPYLY
jgi:hypothetical protein